jgi:anti-sigma factor RsiW
MNEPDPMPCPFPPEWLAGYVDGELAPEERARVEAFLAEHPEGRAELELQSFFAAGNEEFIRRIAPPEVSDRAWARVFANVEMELDVGTPPASAIQPSRPSSGWGSLATVAALTVTLAGFLLLTIPTPLVPVRQGVAHGPVLDEVLSVATADEVEIYSIDESAASGLVVGRHPLSVTPFVLASFEEVDLRGVEPDSQGEYPEVQMTPHGASNPMIWAKLAFPASKER